MRGRSWRRSSCGGPWRPKLRACAGRRRTAAARFGGGGGRRRAAPRCPAVLPVAGGVVRDARSAKPALVVRAGRVDAVVVARALDVLAVEDDVVVVDERRVVARTAVDDVAAGVTAAPVPRVDAVVARAALEAVGAAVVGQHVVAAAAAEAVVARAAVDAVVAAAAVDVVVAAAAVGAVVAGLQRHVLAARAAAEVVGAGASAAGRDR